MFSYRTQAINNCGLNSGKTFWVLVCGYYSREATIRKKTFFCTRALLFPCLQLYFTELIIKNFRKLLVFQVLIHVTAVTSRVKDIRTVKPDFYAVPSQNIFEILPGFQQS